MAQEIATLAGGCFWCTEAVYQNLRGVSSVESGYIGGPRPNPTYEEVCRTDTNHAEVVHLEFDPEQVSYEKLVEVFFANHNPTTRNRQALDLSHSSSTGRFSRPSLH